MYWKEEKNTEVDFIFVKIPTTVILINIYTFYTVAYIVFYATCMKMRITDMYIYLLLDCIVYNNITVF